MKKMLVSLLLSVSIAFSCVPARAAAPAALQEERNYYAEAFVVKSAHHTPDFSGYMILQQFDFFQRGERGRLLRVSMDPEDLCERDVVTVLFYTPTGRRADAEIITIRYQGHIY